MPTYIIFRRETGEFVHVHAEPEEFATAPEDVLVHLDREHDGEGLEVIAVEPTHLPVGVPHRVDPETRTLRPADAGSFAGASARSGEGPARPPHAVRTVYEHGRDRDRLEGKER
jgi:hypothetical protein